MSYYTALISAWDAGTVPNGVTGSLLSGTTQQKLALINAWTISGSIPTTMMFTGSQLANCINATEFFALAAAAQTQVMQLCALPGPLLGGSANTSFLPVGTILKYFNVAGPTVAALTALAQATVTPWWQANGYTSIFTQADLTAAGGLT